MYIYLRILLCVYKIILLFSTIQAKLIKSIFILYIKLIYHLIIKFIYVIELGIIVLINYYNYLFVWML